MTDDDELLAAELAFGLIEGEERRAAEQRLTDDAVFADSVTQWRTYGAAMLDGREEAPRPSLWPRIMARLPANDDAVTLGPAGARGWKFATAAASATALLLAAMVLERRPATLPAPVAARPPLVAMLTGAGSDTVVSVSFDPARRRLTLTAASLAPGARSAELWVIPADKKPRSLGVIDPAGNWREAPAPSAAAITPGATLAVSMEPQGGSPTGQPTGPVMLSGTIHAI